MEILTFAAYLANLFYSLDVCCCTLWFNLIVTKVPRLFRHIMLIWHSYRGSANVDSGIVAFPAAAPVTAPKIVSYTI
jgi:hypothetical protein